MLPSSFILSGVSGAGKIDYTLKINMFYVSESQNDGLTQIGNFVSNLIMTLLKLIRF